MSASSRTAMVKKEGISRKNPTPEKGKKSNQGKDSSQSGKGCDCVVKASKQNAKQLKKLNSNKTAVKDNSKAKTSRREKVVIVSKRSSSVSVVKSCKLRKSVSVKKVSYSTSVVLSSEDEDSDSEDDDQDESEEEEAPKKRKNIVKHAKFKAKSTIRKKSGSTKKAKALKLLYDKLSSSDKEAMCYERELRPRFPYSSVLQDWPEPRAHRMASLNALAKVHVLYENETRPGEQNLNEADETTLIDFLNENSDEEGSGKKDMKSPRSKRLKTATNSDEDTEEEKKVKMPRSRKVKSTNSDDEATDEEKKAKMPKSRKWKVSTNSDEDTEEEKKPKAPRSKKIKVSMSSDDETDEDKKETKVSRSRKGKPSANSDEETEDEKKEAKPKSKKALEEKMKGKAKQSKVKKVIKRRKRKLPLDVELIDTKNCKRMACLNAQAILAASYEPDLKSKKSHKNNFDCDTDSETEEEDEEEMILESKCDIKIIETNDALMATTQKEEVLSSKVKEPAKPKGNRIFKTKQPKSNSEKTEPGQVKNPTSDTSKTSSSPDKVSYRANWSVEKNIVNSSPPLPSTPSTSAVTQYTEVTKVQIRGESEVKEEKQARNDVAITQMYHYQSKNANESYSVQMQRTYTPTSKSPYDPMLPHTNQGYYRPATNMPPPQPHSYHLQPAGVGPMPPLINMEHPMQRQYGASAFTVPPNSQRSQFQHGYYQPAGPLIQPLLDQRTIHKPVPYHPPPSNQPPQRPQQPTKQAQPFQKHDFLHSPERPRKETQSLYQDNRGRHPSYQHQSSQEHRPRDGGNRSQHSSAERQKSSRPEADFKNQDQDNKSSSTTEGNQAGPLASQSKEQLKSYTGSSYNRNPFYVHEKEGFPKEKDCFYDGSSSRNPFAPQPPLMHYSHEQINTSSSSSKDPSVAMHQASTYKEKPCCPNKDDQNFSNGPPTSLQQPSQYEPNLQREEPPAVSYPATSQNQDNCFCNNNQVLPPTISDGPRRVDSSTSNQYSSGPPNFKGSLDPQQQPHYNNNQTSPSVPRTGEPPSSNQYSAGPQQNFNCSPVSKQSVHCNSNQSSPSVPRIAESPSSNQYSSGPQNFKGSPSAKQLPHPGTKQPPQRHLRAPVMPSLHSSRQTFRKYPAQKRPPTQPMAYNQQPYPQTDNASLPPSFDGNNWQPPTESPIPCSPNSSVYSQSGNLYKGYSEKPWVAKRSSEDMNPNYLLYQSDPVHPVEETFDPPVRPPSVIELDGDSHCDKKTYIQLEVPRNSHKEKIVVVDFEEGATNMNQPSSNKKTTIPDVPGERINIPQISIPDYKQLPDPKSNPVEEIIIVDVEDEEIQIPCEDTVEEVKPDDEIPQNDPFLNLMIKTECFPIDESPVEGNILLLEEIKLEVVDKDHSQGDSDVTEAKKESAVAQRVHSKQRTFRDSSERHLQQLSKTKDSTLPDANDPSIFHRSPMAPHLIVPKKERSSLHGWSWEGEPVDKEVYLSNDDPPQMRRCYPAIRHAEGDIIEVEDCVYLRSGPRKNDLPFVAKITALWDNPADGNCQKNEKYMSLLWYYRPEHTETGKKLHHMADEIFASKHRDVNSVACIEDKCYVLTYLEYCRFRKRSKMLEDTYVSQSVSVVPEGETYDRKRKLPLPHTSPDRILFSRRVYDFTQKRLLNNPI